MSVNHFTLKVFKFEEKQPPGVNLRRVGLEGEALPVRGGDLSTCKCWWEGVHTGKPKTQGRQK